MRQSLGSVICSKNKKNTELECLFVEKQSWLWLVISILFLIKMQNIKNIIKTSTILKYPSVGPLWIVFSINYVYFSE